MWTSRTSKRPQDATGAHIELRSRGRNGLNALPCRRLAAAGSFGPLVALDLDLVNCFCMFEWPAVRESYAKHLPDLLPWGVVSLKLGPYHKTDQRV